MNVFLQLGLITYVMWCDEGIYQNDINNNSTILIFRMGNNKGKLLLHDFILIYFSNPTCNRIIVSVTVTLRLAVYHQSILPGTKPHETRDQRFFQLNSCGNSPLWRENMFVTCEYAWPFSSVRIALRASYSKFLLLHHIQVLCQSRFCEADHVYLTYLMLQRQPGNFGKN
jgi:hypothetical protein